MWCFLKNIRELEIEFKDVREITGKSEAATRTFLCRNGIKAIHTMKYNFGEVLDKVVKIDETNITDKQL